MWRRRFADPGSSERTTWNSLIQQLKDHHANTTTNTSSSKKASTSSSSSSSSSASSSSSTSLQTSSMKDNTLIDILVEINGIILPNNAITGEDCGTMIVTIATTVPFLRDDIALCQRACDTIDRIVRTVEVSLQSRHIDILIQFLLQCTNITNIRNTSTSTIVTNGSVPSSSSASPSVTTNTNDTNEILSASPSSLSALEKSLAASALRGLGCIIYENAERCTKWYDTLITRLIPFISSTALPSSAVLCTVSSASPSSSSTATVSVPSSSSGSTTIIPVSDDTVHAALVCLGNLIIRAGSKVKDKHGILYPHILRVLSWGTLLPAQTLPEVQMAGRILSSALRTLLPILQASDSNVRNQFLRTSEDLLRILRDLTTFGWKCDALNRPRKHRSTNTSATAATSIHNSRNVSGTVMTNEPNDALPKNDHQRKGLHTPSSAGLRTPDRLMHNGNNSEHSGTENGEISDRGSVTSRGSNTTRSRWQLIHQQNNYRNTPSSGNSNTNNSTNPSNVPNNATPSSNSMNVRGIGGSSWYTNSDSEDNDDGGGSESGAGFSVAGGMNSSKLKRRIPVRVRATALHCISALAKHSPKLLQSRWELFIPQVQGLSAKPYSVSLLTVLLYDGSHRVQEAAATSLATIVQDAPLHRWIALPVVHNAAAAVVRTSKTGTLTETTQPNASPVNSSTGSSTGITTANGKVTVSPSSARTSTTTGMKRAFNSLSDKTSAMVGELHKALSKALSNVDAEHFPSLATGLLRCAGNVMAVTPYDRLPSGMAYDLCGRAVNLLDSKIQTVAVAALQCIAATFGNTAAVSDIALAQPSSDEMKVITSVTNTIDTNGSSTPVSTLNTGLPENFSRAHQLLRALIAHSGRSSGVAPVVRTELLAVLAKAARHHSPLLASCWSSLQPLLLDAFSDTSPQVRTAALKVIEEILHVRAMILATKTSSTNQDTGTNTTNNALHSSSSSSSAVANVGSTNDDIGLGEDDDNENDKPMLNELSTSGLSGISLPTLDTWTILDPNENASNDTLVIDVSNLLRRYLRAALRDVSPTVRAASTMCMSYLLPSDWAVALRFPTGTSEIEGNVAIVADDTTVRNESIKERDELLQLLASSSFDTTPTVRVAAARVWGAYLAYPEWKTRAFAQASGRILLCLVTDENLSVRAKASWALGNLCAPLSTSPAHAAALAAAVTKRMREYTSTALAPYTQQDPIIGAASSPLFTVYPAIGEEDTVSNIHNLNSIPLWLPERCRDIQEKFGLDTETMMNMSPLSPLELYWTNVSQAALVNLLTLPFLRIVTRAVLDTTTDHDKVSCTAVRTLGYCVQALLYHWLPLPESVRDFVNPVVLSGYSNGSSKGNVSVKRADISACPDDELIKKAMLALADIVAGTVVVLEKKGSTAASPVVEQTGENETVPKNDTKGKMNDTVMMTTGTQKTLPSQNWQEVDEEEDVREVIARRLQGPSMRNLKHPSTTNENNPKHERTEDDENAGGMVGTETKEKKNTVHGGVNIAKGPTNTGSFSSKFRFNTKSSRGITNGADTANWREKPSKGNGSNNPQGGGSNTGNTKTEAKEEQKDPAVVSTNGGTAPAVTTGTVKRSVTTSSSSSSGTVMKVRWNACHAVSQIIPLAHRLVNTHPNTGTLHDNDTDNGVTTLPLTALPLSQTNITTNTKDDGSGMVNLNNFVDIHYLTQPSPPRPRVRRDVSSGQSLMWAGVDHISTANSPFVPKELQPPRSQSVSLATNGIVSSPSGTTLNGNNSTASTNNDVNTNPSSVPSTTVNTPQRPNKSKGNTIASDSSSCSSSSSSSIAIVTDPTYPSVSIGTTWVPPTLAALHLALTQCANFKVRIAAAQALGTVPSRMAYRIPSPITNTATTTGTATTGGTVPLTTTETNLTMPTTVNTPSNTNTTTTANNNNVFPLAPSSHIAPALQRPGYDAYPPALVGLLAALESSEETHDYTEFRYKDQLKGVIRLSLVRTIRLAERMDYGRMKPFFDEKAELLYTWLVAEENLVNVNSLSIPSSLGGIGGLPNHKMVPTINATLGTECGTSSQGSSVIPPSVPGNSSIVNIEDIPIRSSLTPPFGILQPHPSLEIHDIYACFQHLASLFQSRVKTIPPELLKKFQEKAGKDIA